jgi:sugar phosphate isomerase/epimerase
MGLRLAVATEDFGQALRQAIRLAAQNPVQGLRLNARSEVRASEFTDTGLRQLRHFIGEHQMQVAGLYYPSRHSLADPQSLDQRLDGIRAAMGLMRRLGTKDLLLRVGRIPDPTKQVVDEAEDAPNNEDVDSLRNPFSFAPSLGTLSTRQPSEAEQFRQLCEILNDLAAEANRHGVVLQLILSGYDVKPLKALLAEVTSGPIAVVFDSATSVMTGRSPVAVFREWYQRIGYVRLRDARKDVDGGGIEVPMGEGTVDWTELPAVLTEAESRAWVCIERTGGDSRAEDVIRAIRILKETLPGL